MTETSKILIVDDEPDILEILSYNLEKEGYETHRAEDGQEGIDKANELKPDLILLDIMMPKMNGIEVCKELRKSDKFKNTLIAFLTARNEDYTEISALESGGDDYINKPIKPGVFVSRVKALLRRLPNVPEEDKAKIIEVSDIIVDLEKYIVIKGDDQIEMAKKVFEILALLASKPGKVFDREEILNKVWGNDVIVGNRTVDVHIRKLREKIGSNYIKTVKGIGYKFDF